jgi:hypothetical protein
MIEGSDIPRRLRVNTLPKDVKNYNIAYGKHLAKTEPLIE